MCLVHYCVTVMSLLSHKGFRAGLNDSLGRRVKSGLLFLSAVERAVLVGTESMLTFAGKVGGKMVASLVCAGLDGFSVMFGGFLATVDNMLGV